MTQQELDALKALACEAPGEAYTAHGGPGGWYVTVPAPHGYTVVAVCNRDANTEGQMARYIAAACNAVPALVAEVERLTAWVATLEAANADMYRTMEDACKRAEQAERELAAVRYSYAAAMDGERP